MSAETAGLPRAMGKIARLWYTLERAIHVMTTPWAVLGHTATPRILWQVVVASTASSEIRDHLPGFLSAPRMLLICRGGGR